MGSDKTVRLTEYSHGAGCGCKIAPSVLKTILKTSNPFPADPNLLVGYETSDDAAVYDMGNGTSIISTTDFFMPIVDDAETFGRIAATNAISDIYAMGGKPLMAIAILGWPINSLAPEIAAKVIEGGRKACFDAGIRLAGGHSIDAPEPIFGLAVTGAVPTNHIKRNNQASDGCLLFLTKPLGIGILTTAQKKGLLKPEHQNLAPDWMCQMNRIGGELAQLSAVRAMTDVTGFGLMGHLLELCEGSNVSARINADAVPAIDEVPNYIRQGCIPGGTDRNYLSYGDKLGDMSDYQKSLFCDPQTSGGLLIAVQPDEVESVLALCKEQNQFITQIGSLQNWHEGQPRILID